jgi:hypothetical protein
MEADSGWLSSSAMCNGNVSNQLRGRARAIGLGKVRSEESRGFFRTGRSTSYKVRNKRKLRMVMGSEVPCHGCNSTSNVGNVKPGIKICVPYPPLVSSGCQTAGILVGSFGLRIWAAVSVIIGIGGTRYQA